MIMILWILFTAEPNYMLWLYFPSSFFFFWISNCLFSYIVCLCSSNDTAKPKVSFYHYHPTPIYWSLFFWSQLSFFSHLGWLHSRLAEEMSFCVFLLLLLSLAGVPVFWLHTFCFFGLHLKVVGACLKVISQERVWYEGDKCPRSLHVWKKVIIVFSYWIDRLTIKF